MPFTFAIWRERIPAGIVPLPYGGSVEKSVFTTAARAGALGAITSLPSPTAVAVVRKSRREHAKKSGTRVFVEPVNRPLPGQVGRGFVVAFRRRVTIEAMNSARVDIAFVGNTDFL